MSPKELLEVILLYPEYYQPAIGLIVLIIGGKVYLKYMAAVKKNKELSELKKES